jgi:hypothetical protein
MGLFFNDGCVLGLSGRFRSPWIPLGISVEDHVLEIVGLDSELGLILGEFARNSCWVICAQFCVQFFKGSNLGRVVGGLFGFTGNLLES